MMANALRGDIWGIHPLRPTASDERLSRTPANVSDFRRPGMMSQAAGWLQCNPDGATAMGPITRPASEISRRQWTITVAGAVFGAAIGLCVLYWPRAFDVSYFHN